MTVVAEELSVSVEVCELVRVCCRNYMWYGTLMYTRTNNKVHSHFLL